MATRFPSLQRGSYRNCKCTSGQMPGPRAMAPVIHMRDADAVARKAQALTEAGGDALRIIADFDFTLTKFWWDADAKERACSCYKVIEDSGLLHASYRGRAQALQQKYYPIEVCANTPRDEKIAAMLEWVTQANDLLEASGMHRSVIPDMVKDARLKLRDGVHEIFELLRANNTPVLLFSGGIANIIESVFARDGVTLHDDAHIVSNRILFDDVGHIEGWTEPRFHVMNKFAGTIKDEPFMKTTGHRRNIMLFGDSLGDVHMVDGLAADTLLTIGFLNDNVEERLHTYMETYDVVILGDPCMTYHLDLLRRILAAAA